MDDVAEARTRDSVREIIAELAPNRDAKVVDEAHLVDDLEFASLSLTELAFTLEDQFDLPTIDEPVARSISTVGHICDHVVREIRARQVS
ncbi:acyl carrier protein [Plantactinospora sp. WMMC1484]|uniref:acyl carrier protein n=1 Tax=Plantactinospora sp. WMMC1484 TaxID=3404122 RepID=UPI003BF5648D